MGDYPDDYDPAALPTDTQMGAGMKDKLTVAKMRGTHSRVAVGRDTGMMEAKAGVEVVKVVTIQPPTTPTTTHHPPRALESYKDTTGQEGTTREVCSYVDGVCHIHGPAEKLWKPSKVWAKKNNGVFGWKYTKITYFSCRKIARTPMETVKPTFVSMGGAAALHSTTNFTVLCNGGRRGRRGFESKNTSDRK